MAKIGFVSISFARGQTIVTQTLEKAILNLNHESFIFARMGNVYGENKLVREGLWLSKNILYYPTYQIHAKDLLNWAKKNTLDIVVFNEEYDFNLSSILKLAGIRTISYIDYLHPTWIGRLHLYDQCWSATRRTFNLISKAPMMKTRSFYIGWGLDLPFLGVKEPQYDFFSNQGWLGIGLRKGCDILYNAFCQIKESGLNPTLCIHAQVPSSYILNIKPISGLTWIDKEVMPPGLYHTGRVIVQPSRMEGLGLTIPEALWQGRPVITTDAPPMNEFVNNSIGACLPIYETKKRSDGIMFPETSISADILAKEMIKWIEKDYSHPLIREETMLYARNKFDWYHFCNRIKIALSHIGIF